jgi:hypothetical protein
VPCLLFSVPDPYIFLSRIPDPITTKKRKGKKFVSCFFVAINFTNCKLFYFRTGTENNNLKFEPLDKNLRQKLKFGPLDKNLKIILNLSHQTKIQKITTGAQLLES